MAADTRRGYLAEDVAVQDNSDADALAKALSNPVAALISVPFQQNYDTGYGTSGDGERWTLNM